MENLTLKLTRPISSRKGKARVNLYLHKDVRDRAQEAADQRYGWSLSELVDRLLTEEVAGKIGIIETIRSGPRKHTKGWRALQRRNQ